MTQREALIGFISGLTVGETLAEAAAEQAKSVSWWLKTNVADGGGVAPSFARW